MTSLEVYRQSVSKDIQTLNRLILEISNQMEVSLNELNRDTVVMYSNVALHRQQVDLLSICHGEPEGLYPQPPLTPPSVVRLVTCTQPPLMGGPIMAFSGSGVANCPTVVSVFAAPSHPNAGLFGGRTG